MKEIKAIVAAYEEADKTTVNLALATVVRVEGSSYRRTGARMLVMDNGVWVGGISGGCLEGDALKRSQMAIKNAQSTLITYDTTEDDPYQIGVGLGCNGVIDVLFTPLAINDKNNPVEILKACVKASRDTHVLLTVTGLSGQWQSIKTGDVISYNGVADLDVFEDVSVDLQRSISDQLSTGHSAPHKFELTENRQLELFIEILPPEIHIVLIGHQYDVYPLSRLIREMGWRLTVVANPQKVNAHIIAIADEVVAPANFSNILIDAHTAIMLMAHDYNTDKYNLLKALTTQSPYIGMLGPRIRSEKIIRELADEGYPIASSDRDRIHAPVGLDIGAVTPEEIALSFLAEVKASLSGRDGSYLRLRQTTIHQRD